MTVILDKKILILTLWICATLCACLRGSYSRPEGAPALCDDPCELCQPPGIHLKPLHWVISPSTPGPVIEVIIIKASLRGRNIHVEQIYIPHVLVDLLTDTQTGTRHWLVILRPSTLLVFCDKFIKGYHFRFDLKICCLDKNQPSCNMMKTVHQR